MAVFSIGIAGGDVLNGWIKNHVKRVRAENHLMETAGFSFQVATQCGHYFLQYGSLFNHE